MTTITISGKKYNNDLIGEVTEAYRKQKPWKKSSPGYHYDEKTGKVVRNTRRYLNSIISKPNA